MDTHPHVHTYTRMLTYTSIHINTFLPKVAVIPEVRKRIAEKQREMSGERKGEGEGEGEGKKEREGERERERERGVVMEGRDIGTVVLPSALVKVFLTAPLSLRARRRYEELKVSLSLSLSSLSYILSLLSSLFSPLSPLSPLLPYPRPLERT